MAPALGLPDITKPFQLYIDKGKDKGKGIGHSKVRPLESPSGIPIKEIRPCAFWMASLLENYHLHSLASQGCEQIDSGQELYITTPHDIEGVSNPRSMDEQCMHVSLPKPAATPTPPHVPIFYKCCPEPSLSVTRPGFGDPTT